MFRKDQSGNVALLFAVMLPVLTAAGGGGLEIARALEYKQRLVSAADLACWQAEKYVESTLADNPKLNYTSSVAEYGTKNRTERNLSNATISAVPVPSVSPTRIDVTASGTSDLIFKGVVGRDSVSFTVTRTCAVDATTAPTGTLLISESFEKESGQHSVSRNNWSVLGYSRNSTSSTWNGWNTTNAGIEINGQAALTGDSIRFGEFFAELDSHCFDQSCTRTNSAMSRKLTLTKNKNYEIRYWYVARKKDDNPYPNYSVICSNPTSSSGTQRNQDVAFATADKQTRRIELYVEPYDDKKSNGGYIDFKRGTNTNYSNLTDVCVWADEWTERKYTFKATQSSEYRITWAAAGEQDTYGGLIDYLRICEGSCL